MAGALFSVASNVLSTAASPAFEMAYERACSVWGAREELDKLKTTIRTVQAVLLDAERKQNHSAAVKDWMERVKEALYDADDLFDEVATDDMLRQQIKGNEVSKKVRRLNPIVSNNSVAEKVKSVRKSLLAISEDMKIFNFAICQENKPISRLREGQETGSFVDPKSVIGRDKDKQAILEMLLHESEQHVGVIAIVGIGGMGKTTLTQLVYNDKDVEMNFEKRWFACISDTSEDKEVFGKILQSIDETYNGNFSVNILQNKIKEAIRGKKFLLVLDDVWDDARARWLNRMSFLSSGAKGSKIIVSTRSEVVARAVGARAVGAFETHNLCGLSEEDSWNLFKSVVSFTPEQEKDPTWITLGREIVKKCANVPLAIKSIASLLFEKDTIQEWETIRNEDLPRLGRRYEDSIMPVLKLSYEYLPSNLKHCFAYSSLFPKDYLFRKEELINLWIAQGYVSQSNEKQVVEDIGYSYFMDLFRRSFFEAYFSKYKMHDLIHDLAIHVAGEESLMLTTSSNEMIRTRHVSVGCVVDDSWILPESLHNVNRLRSFLFLGASGSRLAQGIQFSNWKSLRALGLGGLRIINIPSCLWELKHLRYLDISKNDFKELPDCITKLVNLCTLDISECRNLESLPSNFGKLFSLRHLYNNYCSGLKQMPPGFEELTSLQHLDSFKVGKGMEGGQRFRLDGLSQLKQLRGKLGIWFEDETDGWDGIECWQPPLSLEVLQIMSYKGTRLPHWGNGRAANPSSLPKLTSLQLSFCPSVKCLPSFRHIPNLKILQLVNLKELEYIEEEEAGSEALFIPDLERLELHQLPKLKAWSRKDCSNCTIASLSRCRISECPELKSIQQLPITDTASPSTPSSSSSRLDYVEIRSCDGLECFPGESLTSLRNLGISHCMKLKKVELPPFHLNKVEKLELRGCPELELLPIVDTASPSTPSSSSSCLEDVSIRQCDGLECFPGESLTSLRRLQIESCMKLKKVELPPFHLNNLEELKLENCRELELWEEEKRGVDWDSLPKLRLLTLGQLQSPERLPDSLRRRQQLGKLTIEKWYF